MPDIEWSENVPDTTESAGLGAQRIQSLKTAIRTGLNFEHQWPTSGLGAGVHRLGSARPYYGTESLVSSSGTDGRLMVTSDTSRLFHVGSAGTMLLGSQNVLSAGSQPPGGQRFYWAQEFGSTDLSVGQTSIAFPNSGFSGIPFVFLSINTESGAVVPAVPKIRNLTATAFTAAAVIATTGAVVANSATTLMWLSIGTRVL